MPKLIFIFSSISGLLAVGLGAFGAHALRTKLEADNTLHTFHTAVQYQFYHTLALLAVALLMMKFHNPVLGYAGWSFTFGILVFSGSLYVLCFTGMKWLGAITPIGGLAFIAGWVLLLVAVLKIQF